MEASRKSDPRLAFLLLAITTLQAAVARNPDPKFHKTIQPFLDAHCVECHGPEKAKGKLRFDTLTGDFSREGEIWQGIQNQILKGEMPPKEKPIPAYLESQVLLGWIEKNAPYATPLDLHLPKFGNKIDHASLFSGEFDQPGASPQRLWKLRPSLYEGTLGKNSGETTQPFSAPGREGIQDYSADQSIDDAETLQLITNARSTIEKRSVHDPELAAIFSQKSPLDRGTIERVVRRQFALTLLREPEEEELRRFVQLAKSSISKIGSTAGLKNTLAAVMLHPEAVFRFEIGNTKPDQAGRRLLSSRELAFAIAYALTDQHPDPTLLKSASSNRLANKLDVTREVRRILHDNEIAKPRILRFFREYFQYHHAPEVFKDFQLNFNHAPHVLVADTDQLILHILDQDHQVFTELLTTNKTYVNYLVEKEGRKTRANQKYVQDSYDLPFEWAWTDQQPLLLSREERAGILTQPSWLVAHSSNFHNHVIRRGKWIREHLLGGHVPDLPITVDAQLPDEPNQPLRHRMRVTREEACWKCHRKMDPLGFTFESYDHFGRHRLTEFKLPVDSQGHVDLTRDSSLHGDFPNAVALIHHLAKTDRARQMFIRYAFRYWMGRNEELSDSRTLIQADQAYLKSNGSFKELLISLLSSDAFLYRISPK